MTISQALQLPALFSPCTRPPRRGSPKYCCPEAQGDNRRPKPGLLTLALALALIFGASPARSQEQRKRKIPVVDKMTQGSSRQAFSGKVESLDLDLHVLEVNASEGKTMEIFPVKKGIQVSTADGEKLKLEELRPGNNVIIYYEQKGDHRTVKQIVVLATDSDQENKKPPPSS